jgi:NAD(P)-dependent dehydrogenase (short-subunit alcohol dehydrogenase family)
MRRTMATNAFGPLMLYQALVPLMKKGEYGRIVNVSRGIGELSILGRSYPAYRISKIVLNIHTRILADELQGTGILVNAMCPGWVRTGMGGIGAPRSLAEGADTAAWLATLPDDGPHGSFFRDHRQIPW